MARPPQHSARAPIEFLDLDDPAWDGDAWIEELKHHPKGYEHPMAQYRSGDTRYDMSAPGPVYTPDGEVVQKCPRDYLKPDADPPIVTLARLKPAEVAKCRDMGGNLGKVAAMTSSFVSIAGMQIDMGGRKRGLTDAQVEHLADLYGMAWVYKVGEAAILASEAPTYAEKKP